MSEEPEQVVRLDPRDQLRDWANGSDEWTRYIVREVLTLGTGLGPDEQAYAYALFRQEKALDPRILPTEDSLPVLERDDEKLEPLVLTSLSGVTGVNALVTDGVIEPHEGLTILFGENGTGKTGYSRVFKALAASRTADVILGNVDDQTPQAQSALVGFRLGTEPKTYEWTGEQGVSPFTRMSIFDGPSVTYHVDADLEYVYVPAALALFNHVTNGIKAVYALAEAATMTLRSGSLNLLSRFARGTAVYPHVETLGAATDLERLRATADFGADSESRLAELRQVVAALDADTIGAQILLQQRAVLVLGQGSEAAHRLTEIDFDAYHRELDALSRLEGDYQAFRDALFQAADLAAEPDETWAAFIGAGETYQAHLSKIGAHDATRCLYCRQPLDTPAMALIAKYSDYLEDKIASDIAATRARVQGLVRALTATQTADAEAYVSEYAEHTRKPAFHEALDRTISTLRSVTESVRAGRSVGILAPRLKADMELIDQQRDAISTALGDLRAQADSRIQTLADKKLEVAELEAATELAKSWSLIEKRVRDAKEADRLVLLTRPMPTLQRAVTTLAKAASDQMINESFESLFEEERAALRAPANLKVEFVGREGKAQRHRAISGRHKPSKVLSEGEQKVIAMADFLAEARLAGITAPVIFDDPVSSLDHRRVGEVARRIVALAASTQIIVFTHDILFATTLLALMEESKRCSYFQITDEEGKGHVARATGPRWDSLSDLRGRINETIQSAKAQDGEARAALVRHGYALVRSWCEVFTEAELLQGVTLRYQPNVRMTNLGKINVEALPSAIETVTRVFEDACRHIDAHSQPLVTLGVAPTLAGLEGQWAELQDVRKAYNSAK